MQLTQEKTFLVLKTKWLLVKIAAQSIIDLIKEGHEITISHGNGPQVGAMLLQNEASDSDKLPAMPLDTLVASTEGMIGYLASERHLQPFASK
jgi:carbamate kinase